MKRILLGNHNQFANSWTQNVFNPRDLFSSNEQGLWLDPSDMTREKAAWRRNLLLNTEALSLSPWTADGATFSANTTVAPDGTTTAGTFTGASGNYRIYQQRTSVVGASHTISLYVKQGTSPTVQIDYINVNNGPVFTFATESFSTVGGFTTNVQNVGSGWYRLSITANNINVNPGPGFRASGATTFFLWGVQYEQSSTPTEYQRITDFSTEFKLAFPTHTLYQDAVPSGGTTPCTVAGDPVGFIIDQSRGGLGNLGSELLVDTGFDNAASWTIGGGSPPSITGGQAVWNASTGNVSQLNRLVIGRWYRIQFDLVSYTSGTLNFRDGTTSMQIATTGATPGTKSVFFYATQTNAQFISFSAATLTIDNVSIKELPGNHAYQATSGQRPTLARIPSGGRRNILVRTEEFDNVGWSKGLITVTANTDIAPDGTQTAETITTSVSAGNPNVSQTVSLVSGQQYTFSVYIKAGTNTSCVLNVWGPGVGVFANQTFTGLSSSWTRCVFTFTSTVTSASCIVSISPEGLNAGTGKSVIIWGAQFELGNSATNYQKVVSTHDVTESGFADLWHLSFDGSDDSLVTYAVDFATWTQETRRNLLTDTESFGTASWTKTNATVTENTVANPVNGETTADKLVETAATGFHSVYAAYTYGAGSVVTLSVYAKAAERSWLVIGSDNATAEQVFFDLANGTVGNQGTGYVGSIASVGNGWYRCSVVITQATALPLNYVVIGVASSNNTSSYAGDGTSGILIWGAQLETGSSATSYQRVGTDEMTVIAGLQKLSDAASATFVEASADASSNNGAFAIYAPRIANAAVEYRSRGTLTVTANEGIASAAPSTLVFTGQSDISGDSVIVRKNGVQAGSSASDQGTGNYGNHILYIGRRTASSTLPYNGHLYQLIVRGKTTPTNQLIRAEDYTRTRTPIMAPVIISPPTISGTVELGQTLTATASYAHGNRPITTTWQWLRGGTPISGATSSTYRIRVEDVGSTLTAVQTDTNSAGSYSVASAATVVVPAYTFASLFATNEQGVLYDLSEMTDTKTTWRRNLLTYSERLTTSPWSANEASLESATPPSGIGLAWKLKETGNSGVHFVGRVLNTVLSASVQHTLSVYAKAGERNILSIVGESTATTLCDFDLSAGTAHPAASATGTITSVGDGWYRCSMTWTATASPSTTYFATKQSLAGGLVFTGTLNSGLFLAAAQLERASSPTEYQPITDFSTEFKAAFPTHTLYQDSNGVTPCTAAGDPVGLILDQSRGGLGAKTQYTLTNGSFDSGSTGWTASNATVDASVSGQLTVTGASAGSIGIIQQEITGSVAGQWWEIVADVQVTSSSGVLGFWTGAANSTVPITGTHRQTVRMITLAAGTVQARVGTVNVIGASIIVYDVKVYQVPGNHAYQTTSGARPTLARIPSSGRRNLLTRTEEFDNAAWVKTTGVTVTANAIANPLNGEVTADLITNDASSKPYHAYHTVAHSAAAHSLSFYVKANTGIQYLQIWNTSAVGYANFDIVNGIAGTTGAGVTSAITSLGNGWFRISVSSIYGTIVYFGSVTSNSAARAPSDTTAGSYYLWGAQLETGSTATTYQRVTSTFDVVEANQASCYGIQFDGSDDSLITNSVDFSGTDKVTLVSGVSKFVLSYTPEIVALSSNADINNGSFAFGSGENNSTNWLVSLRGNTALNSYSPRQYPSPTTNLVTALYDISQAVKANEITARINGIVDNGYSIGSESGGGNFGNYPLYLGRRAGTVLPFTGIIWNLVIRGSSTASNTLISTEEFASENTPGVTL